MLLSVDATRARQPSTSAGMRVRAVNLADRPGCYENRAATVDVDRRALGGRGKMEPTPLTSTTSCSSIFMDVPSEASMLGALVEREDASSLDTSFYMGNISGPAEPTTPRPWDVPMGRGMAARCLPLSTWPITTILLRCARMKAPSVFNHTRLIRNAKHSIKT